MLSFAQRGAQVAFSALLITSAAGLLAAKPAGAQTLLQPGVLIYGDENLEGYGYPADADPTVGASLSGLSAGATTLATNAYQHGFPFSPGAGEYAGTDQIYVGSNQTGSDDGYSSYSGRLAGPQVVTFNYASLIPAGATVTGITFGIAADDFQFPSFGNPFTATINGVTNTAITTEINSLNQTGPYEQFFSVGIGASSLLPSNVLTYTVNEGGNGGDGWATDFFTISVQTTGGAAAAPEPTAIALSLVGIGTSACGLIRKRRAASKQ